MRNMELAGLARTLSHDHGMTITVSGDQSFCSADGAKINIARMPETALGKQLMCGLIFHETGHANHTTGDKPPGLLGHMTNVIEDIRVEALTMVSRPGTRYDLEKVATYYAEKHPFNPQNSEQALLGLVMALGRGHYLKQTRLLEQVESCKVFLSLTLGMAKADKVESLLSSQLPQLQSTRDSIDLAESLLSLIQRDELMTDQPQDEGPQKQTNSSSNASDSPQELTAESEQETQECSLQETEEADTGTGYCTKDGTNIEDFGDLQGFLIDELDQLSNQTSPEEKDLLPEYPAIAKAVPSEQPFDTSAALVSSARMRARLPLLLQSIRNLPTGCGTHGRKLDLRKVHRIAFGNPNIFQKKAPVTATNTAVVILLDSSGSMFSAPQGTPLYKIANQSAFALHHCLYGLPGISATSIAFAGQSDDTPALQLLCDFKQKPRGQMFDITPRGETPTDQALWHARTALLHQPEPRKLIMVLTDGYPDNPSKTLAATMRCRKDGIEIAAIGIQTDAVQEFWEQYQVIHDVNELPKAIFETLSISLTHHIR